MKANELRIGNLVQSTDPLDKPIMCLVTGIDDVWIFCSGAAFGEARCQGIPLTAGWLERMGFEPCGFPTGTLCKTSGKEGMVLLKDHYGWYQMVMSYDDFAPYGIIVQYVHQVQNLFFAVTGEELTISGI